MPQIIQTELLGNDLSAVLNDASLQAVVDDVVTAFKQGDTDLSTLISNLRVDARQWFDQAMAAASTLDSGLQRTQLEAIVAQLKPWIAGRTVTIGGDIVTLESAFLMLTAAPAVQQEQWTLGADKLPAANLVTFVDGRQTNMISTNVDDGVGTLTCTFAAADYYLGAPGEYVQKYAYSVRDLLGKPRKHNYVLIERSRVRFDLSRFLVAGSTYDGLDLDGNGTTDGSIPAPPPIPEPIPTPEPTPAPAPAPEPEPAPAPAPGAAELTALQQAQAAKQSADSDVTTADALADQTEASAATAVQTRDEAQTALTTAQTGGDADAIASAQATYDQAASYAAGLTAQAEQQRAHVATLEAIAATAAQTVIDAQAAYDAAIAG